MLNPKPLALLGALLATSLFFLTPSQSARDDTPDHKPLTTVNGQTAAANELLLRYDDGLPNAQKDQILNSLGAELIHRFTLINADHIRLPAGTDLSSAMPACKNIPGIQYTEPNYCLQLNINADATRRVPRDNVATAFRPSTPAEGRSLPPKTSSHLPNDPYYYLQWALPHMDVPAAWQVTKGKKSVIVGIMTGVDIKHPDLAANIWVNKAELNGIEGVDDDNNGYIDDVHGYDFGCDDPRPYGKFASGTNISGVIGAVGDNGIGVVGVNQVVSLMPLKPWDDNGSGFTADIIEAFEYAKVMNVSVMNCFFSFYKYSQPIKDAIEAFGGVVSCAVDVWGTNLDKHPYYPACYDSPNVITSTCSGRADENHDFDWGIQNVDLGAPGGWGDTEIASTKTGRKYDVAIHPVSSAAAFVSGAAALVRAAYPQLSGEQMVDRLRESVDLAQSQFGLSVTGGRLNVGKAVWGRSVGGRFAGNGWELVSTTGPAPRHRHAMAYDSRRGRVVLFGGFDDDVEPYVTYGDTWEWDGNSWCKISNSGPDPRYSHAMAYDSRRRVVVLFGGQGKKNYQDTWDDTWEWDGRQWLKVSEKGPEARWGHAMAYDSKRRIIVLFGGFIGGSLRDTWEWDGIQWKRVNKSGPKERRSCGFTYDAARKKVVLFGGSGNLIDYQDTWEWDGHKWMKLNNSGPAPRDYPSMIYDSHRKTIVLFGGLFSITEIPEGSSGRFMSESNDIWELDGDDWRFVGAGGPRYRWKHAMAYDERRKRIILFGGYTLPGGTNGETWAYRPPVKPFFLDNLPVGSADFNGDGAADLALWRPTGAEWHIQGSPTISHGKLGDIPAPGDYNGDGKADYVLFRPATGKWYFKSGKVVNHGRFGDIPVPADYDGDGRTDIAVYRPEVGKWLIHGENPIQYGCPADIPVPADYDGDGRDDIALFRPSSCLWQFYNGQNIKYGKYGDVPVPADYNGDGKADIAVFRTSNAKWLIKNQFKKKHGARFDIPVPGDYNGDGSAQIATFRPSNGTWYIHGQKPIIFGRIGDVPLVRGK